jgi:cell wall-associated NlpC family hydrolase
MVSFTRTNLALSGLLFLLSLGQKVAAQDNKLRTLSQLYSQGHYKLVYRKAGRLLMNPAYDQNKEPAQYRQLAALELAKNPNWAKRHAQELAWIEKPVHTSTEQNFQVDFQTQQLLKEAQKHIGVPYKAAGTDPAGFDCSGFTCYIFEKQGVKLPRRAMDQYSFCQAIDPEKALAGDLVFFSDGNTVNHVGILISEKGAPKQMIHSSSSIGISIVDIETSTYWQTRIAGYGRVKP